MKCVSAAIATAPFPILGANDRVSLGIVGLGKRGTDHLNYYSSFDADCRITAVCDVHQAARERAVALLQKRRGYSAAEYSDMRALFDSKEIDAVSLPLPNHWHALATIWACQAGKDVYVEKPASHNLFEGGKMVLPPGNTAAWCKWARKAAPSLTRNAPWSCCGTARSGRCTTREGCAFGAASPSAIRRMRRCRRDWTGIASSAPRR